MKTVKELESIATKRGYNVYEVLVEALHENGLIEWEGYPHSLVLYCKFLEDIASEEEHGTT